MKEKSQSFDVVMVHGETDDGEGAKVLRARPGRIEAGEVRPMREGKPMGAGDIVRLEKRKDAAALYDVHVEHTIEPAQLAESADTAAPRSDGPAQVATRAYRESWERTFGRRQVDAPN